MSAAVLKLAPPAAESDAGYRVLPTLNQRIHGNGRAIFVKKLREIADAVERGELDGARAQWLDTHSCRVEVEVDGSQREFNLADVSAPQPPEGVAQQPISGMETLTRTAWREDGSGKVKYEVTTILEEG